MGEALELIVLWPAAREEARKRRERLMACLERKQNGARVYEALRQEGYLAGSGLTEQANDLVVPQMKNGKMHWSREAARAVVLLRAHVLTIPEGGPNLTCFGIICCS